MNSRFALEEAIYRVWGTKEDLDLMYHSFYEFEDNDELANMMLGIMELLDKRCKQLEEIFTEVVHSYKVDDKREDVKGYPYFEHMRGREEWPLP